MSDRDLLPLLLIVDDNTDFLDAMVSLLEHSGLYRVAQATDGLEALRLMEQSTPDLIISDISMPHMNGFELLSRVRASEQWRHLPVIFLSALNSPEDVQNSLDAGADGHIGKPFSPETLLKAIAAFFV